MEEIEPFVSIHKIAWYLGTTPKNIYNLCSERRKGLNNFPCHKIRGAGLKFLMSEVKEWATGQKILSQQEILERTEEKGKMFYWMAG